MSALEMASVTKFSYQRLRNDVEFDDDFEDIRQKVIGRSRNRTRVRKVPIRKRFKLRIPSLRRFLRRVRLISAVRVSFAKVVKRLKESQSHFGDLFAGNYLFLQVSPTPFKSIQKSCNGHGLYGLSSGDSLPRIA